jgi:hypothetical protein
MNKGLKSGFQGAMEVPSHVKLREVRLPGAIEVSSQIIIWGSRAASRSHVGTWSGEIKGARCGFQGT